MESVRDSLDLLLRHGALTERQHRKLVRAADYLERPPAAPGTWARTVVAALHRPPEYDVLGLRLLRGDVSEAAFSARLKIDCVVVASCWGFAMLVVFGVQRFWEAPGVWSVRGPAAALLASATMFGVFFYLLIALPAGLWWSRRRRRLDALRAQREAGGDV